MKKQARHCEEIPVKNNYVIDEAIPKAIMIEVSLRSPFLLGYCLG
jgi:hypothetical protein